jgi:hypothetical protein
MPGTERVIVFSQLAVKGLRESDVEKDLGVMVDSKLLLKEHVASCTAKANKVVGIIRRTFDHLSEQTCIRAWCAPYLNTSIVCGSRTLKSYAVRWRTFNEEPPNYLVHSRTNYYPERLRALKLPCLEHRRLHGDMLGVYKYLHGYYKVQRPVFQKATTSELRGNSHKLHKCQYRLNIRGNYFSQRTITTWNNLPDAVVTAPSINAFKSRIDHHRKNLPSVYKPDCQN